MPTQDFSPFSGNWQGWIPFLKQRIGSPQPKSQWNVLGKSGEDVWKIIEQQMKGLSPEELAQLQGQAGGQLRSGEQQIREGFAGTGAPIGAQIGANIANRSNINRNLQQGILSGNLAARGQGIQNYLGVEGLRQKAEQDIWSRKFAEEQLQAQIDAQPSFLESLLGNTIGAAGQIGGGLASKTCFCYAETFGNTSREFIQARNWGLKYASETARQGYMKLSSLVIPIMRKSPLFKKWFKKFALHVLKGMRKVNISLIVMYSICLILGKFKLTAKENETLNTVFNA